VCIEISQIRNALQSGHVNGRMSLHRYMGIALEGSNINDIKIIIFEMTTHGTSYLMKELMK
jgi:hypothetical protein